MSKMNCFLVIFMVTIIWGNAKALNCRTDGGPKDDQLRSVFTSCLKKYAPSNQEITYHRDNNGNMKGDRAYSMESTRNSENGMNKDQMPQHGDNSRDGPQVQSTTMSSNRRHKRERENQMKEPTNGQRSQYNPNTQPRDKQDNMGRENDHEAKSQNHSNMSGNNMMNHSIEDDTACVVHCFLQDLEMTGDNGMPDRHMVTNVLTRDVNKVELKEFLQESIDECFQIIQNDNIQDKCQFSKTLMMCLSEKGRTNCDDWKEGSIHF